MNFTLTSTINFEAKDKHEADMKVYNGDLELAQELLRSAEVDIVIDDEIKIRLEYLRGEIEAENIATAELLELQSLAKYIDKNDTLLLEWAGVPEHEDEDEGCIFCKGTPEHACPVHD